MAVSSSQDEAVPLKRSKPSTTSSYSDDATPQPVTEDDGHDYAKAQKKLFLEYLSEKDKKRLSEAERKILNNTTCCSNASGNGMVMLDNSGHAFAESIPGHVIIKDSHPLDSKEHIEAELKGALMAKASMPDGAYMHASDELRAAMRAKCADMTGVKLLGGRPEKTLKELNPELDAKVEAQWKAMGGTVPGVENKASAHIPGSVVTADAATFRKEVLDSPKPVILEITDATCDVCDREHPEVDSVAIKAGDKAKVVRMDLMELHDVVASLPENDPLRKQLDNAMNGDKPFGVPALAVLDQGQMKSMQIGFKSADQIQSFANDAAGQTIVPSAISAAISQDLRQQLRNG